MSVDKSIKSYDRFFTTSPANPPPHEFRNYQNEMLKEYMSVKDGKPKHNDLHVNTTTKAIVVAHAFYIRRRTFEKKEQARRMRNDNIKAAGLTKDTIDLTVDKDMDDEMENCVRPEQEGEPKEEVRAVLYETTPFGQMILPYSPSVRTTQRKKRQATITPDPGPKGGSILALRPSTGIQKSRRGPAIVHNSSTGRGVTTRAMARYQRV